MLKGIIEDYQVQAWTIMQQLRYGNQTLLAYCNCDIRKFGVKLHRFIANFKNCSCLIGHCITSRFTFISSAQYGNRKYILQRFYQKFNHGRFPSTSDSQIPNTNDRKIEAGGRQDSLIIKKISKHDNESKHDREGKQQDPDGPQKRNIEIHKRVPVV